MGNRIKAWNVLSRILFILVFAASLAVFWFTRTGEGYMDLIINLIFAAAAGIFLIIYFEGSARPLAKVASSLSNVTEDILESDGDPKKLWERYGKREKPFGNKRLDDRYTAYVREMHRLQSQNALTADCRIEDYINEELLYAAVNKPFCDQLGGIMSGLGILFTFIGLVYGLRNFDASTVDVMQSSTQALMAGIKIAFLTSIFGLIYSLLLGLSYKKLMRDSTNALYAFQDAFVENVRPSNEHGAENAMLRLQMEQNAALQSFGTSIGDQVSEAIITLMQPVVRELHDTITQYVTVAIEDQRAGMEKVVRYFLDSMNSSLGNIFVQLKNRTEELSRWQKDMIDAITGMTASTAKTGKDLAEAQALAVKITESMASYTDAIDQLTTKQLEVTENMQRFIDEHELARERETEYLRSIGEAAQAAAANSRESLKVAESVSAIAAGMRSAETESAERITEAGRQITQAAAAVREMSEAASGDINAAATRLEHAAGDMESGLSRSVSDSISMMDDSISRLTNCMNSVTSAANNVTQSFRALPKTVSAADTDLKAVTKAIDAEMKVVLKAVSDLQKTLNRFNADLERRADL